jgi:peptidoglycan/LPS O-acetylase OafA/YrhL
MIHIGLLLFGTVVAFALAYGCMWAVFFSNDEDLKPAIVYVIIIPPLCEMLAGQVAGYVWGNQYGYVGLIIGAILLAAFPTIYIIARHQLEKEKQLGDG